MDYLNLIISIPDTNVVNKIPKSQLEEKVSYLLMTVLSISQDSIRVRWEKEKSEDE